MAEIPPNSSQSCIPVSISGFRARYGLSGHWTWTLVNIAAATFLATVYPASGQDQPTAVESLVQDPGGAPAATEGENLVTPLQLDQMLGEFDLPPSTGEVPTGLDADGNPLFSNSAITVDPATLERARAMSALLQGNTQVGPFGLTGPFLGFQSGLAVIGMYDSNILQISDEQSQEIYGQGPESFVMRFSPFARYRSPGPVWFMEAGYSPSYVMYTDFSDLDGWEQNGDISLRYDIREWEAQIQGYYRTTITGSSLNQLARRQSSPVIGGTTDSSFDRDGLGGTDYGGRIRGAYTGQRLQASLGAGYGLSDGQNRYYNSDVREERYDSDFRVSYALTPKTSLQFDGGYAYRGPYTPDIEVEPPAPPPPPPPIYVNSLGQVVPPPPGTIIPTPAPVAEEEKKAAPVVTNYPETTTARMNLAALWKVTPLLELGPGVRATYDSRSDGLSSNSFGPLVRARYQLSRNVSLSGQVAAEFHQFDERVVEPVAPPPPPPQPQIILVPDPVLDPTLPVTPTPVVQPAPVVAAPAPEPVPAPEPEPTFQESDSPFISAELAGVWSPTDQWSVRLALARSSRIGSGTGEDFREVFSTRASVIRSFDRGNIMLTGGYEIESPLREPTNGQTSLERQFLTVDLSYSFPIYKDRAFATTFFRYRDDQTGAQGNNWDGYQTGLSIAITF